MGETADICALNIVIKFGAQKSYLRRLGDNQATAGRYSAGGNWKPESLPIKYQLLHSLNPLYSSDTQKRAFSALFGILRCVYTTGESR
jgi:hypothetical protein